MSAWPWFVPVSWVDGQTRQARCPVADGRRREIASTERQLEAEQLGRVSPYWEARVDDRRHSPEICADAQAPTAICC